MSTLLHIIVDLNGHSFARLPLAPYARARRPGMDIKNYIARVVKEHMQPHLCTKIHTLLYICERAYIHTLRLSAGPVLVHSDAEKGVKVNGL